MEKVPITVSRKIIADVSRGIYRTPANAIKELVSNAFDACATRVWITTNYPYFDTFTCEDNGNGMSKEHFKDVLGRIGSSDKRANKAQSIINCDHFKRPIIGKIGIGLLSVSQICNKFTVISKEKGQDTIFKAHIDLGQFDEDPAYTSGEANNIIKLGESEIDTIEVSKDEIPKSYTKIIMESIRDEYKAKFKEQYTEQIISSKKLASNASDFAAFLESLYDISKPLRNRPKDLKKFSQYDVMIWELSLVSPTRYFTKYTNYLQDIIFPTTNLIKDDIERLDQYEFRVFFDGMEIFRPIMFFRSKEIDRDNEDFKVYHLPSFDEDIAGERLCFHGYIYSQRVRVRPIELQGILIRIKDVAIGSFDKSILKYPREEGSIFGMISGEIVVEYGLENALNIDRNSFNEAHPHYQELQLQIHKFIKDHVVNDIRLRSRNRRSQEKEQKVNNDISEVFGKISNNWDINFEPDIREECQDQPYLVDEKEKKLVFFTKAKGWSDSEKERLLQMKVVAAFALNKYLKDKNDTEDFILDMVFGKNE